ncbi:MAG: putative metal-binding motif-containing protein, partial [Candidatus Methylumidiphilus sp.]
NDKHPTINPGAKEICTNKLDDDCNGKIDQADPGCTGADCIAARVGKQVSIDAAGWALGKLTVTGSKAVVGATVTVTNAIDGAALGTATVAYNGAWKFEKAIAASANAPCRVQAAINGAVGVRPVNGTTANCASNNGAPPACGP